MRIPLGVSLLLISGGLLLSGCGGSGRPSLVKVTGKVTLDDQPLADAQIALQFIADESSKYQRPSRALTNASGEYTPNTYGNDDGLPVGKYRVGILKREVVGELPKDFNSENPDAYNLKYRWITPRKYSDPTTSGLTIEVTSSGIEPATLALSTDGQPPEIEQTGPRARANDP